MSSNPRSILAGPPWAWRTLEVLLIVLLFFLLAGWPPPDVNESHYLAKAKHYWNSAWCRGDHFLTSADAHLVFYWTLGWLTRWLPLPAVAWVGRFVTWSLLAWAWQRLSYAVVPARLAAVASAGLVLLFQYRFHMAGEWMVGGVEAKGFAYAFVLLAVEAMLRQRWNTAGVCLGAAMAFHPVVGGWSLVAAGCAWWSCGPLRPRVRSLLLGLAGGLLLALPGLVPALLLNHGVSAEVAREANYIYVYQRLPHHLVFHRFPHEFMVRQAILLVLWLVVCKATPCPVARGVLGQRPLRGFVGGAVAIAVAGIVIDQLLWFDPDLAASLLRYYWYRLSDSMLPVGAALALVACVHQWRPQHPRLAGWAWAALILVSGGSLAVSNFARRFDLRPGADIQSLPSGEWDPAEVRRAHADWLRVCRWIAQHTDRDAGFLTPRHQQTFKWYAERREVCCWKDVPQDAAALVEWWRRQEAVYVRGLAAHGEQHLLELARKYGVQYIVIDRQSGPRRLDLPRVYPSVFETTTPTYEVYRVPSE